ncbi:MAG: BON domain-containing protein [Planctomycetota bacterium]|nr:BON domain-containing protein [Planctomycetota bacterium]
MIEATMVKDWKASPTRGLRSTSRRMDFDGDLATRAEGCLQRSGYTALQNISCESRDGVLVLRGRVSSYYLKQLAQETVRRIEGVESIVNAVEVFVDKTRVVCVAPPN